MPTLDTSRGLAGLSLRQRATVLAYAAGVREGRHSLTCVIVDDDGTGHLRGGFARQEERGTTNAERQAYGYTKAEVEGLWRELAQPAPGPRGGVPRATSAMIETFETLLCEALVWIDEKRELTLPSDGAAGRMMRYRERLKSWGFCLGGCGRPAAEGRSKCFDCNEAAKAAVKAGRARKKLAAALA